MPYLQYHIFENQPLLFYTRDFITFTIATFVVEFETAVEVASVDSDGHNLPPETLCCFVIQQGGLLDLLLHPKWENGGKSQNIFLQV